MKPPKPAGGAVSGHRVQFGRIADVMVDKVGAYMIGNLLISVAAGLASFIVFTALGVPFAVPLAFAVGLCDLIPMIGATLGAVIGVLVTLSVTELWPTTDRLKIISIRIRRWQVTWVSATILSEAGTSGGDWRGVVYGMLTRIVVKHGKRSELLEYLRWDAEVAKASEPGTWRFDVWEAEREPGVVYLYEAYKDRAAFEDHAKGDPYKKWDEVAGKTMEQVTDVIPLTQSLASNVDE